MKKGIERRRYIRVPLALPFVIMTPRGAIKGKTADMSVGGLAFILPSEAPIFEDEFQITIKSSEDDEMSITCEKVWAGSITVNDSVYNATGARFTKISTSDHNKIAAIVAGFYV